MYILVAGKQVSWLPRWPKLVSVSQKTNQNIKLGLPCLLREPSEAQAADWRVARSAAVALINKHNQTKPIKIQFIYVNITLINI